jgi:DNA-binding transcriptional LysR family regulator
MANQFEDLRTFVAVVDGKGISAAARELKLVKSAVSRRLGELEDRLGTRLLNRSTRTLALTDSGAAFYARAVRVLADLQEAEAEASKGALQAVGKLRIAAPVSFTIHCLAPALPRFMQAHPDLELDIDTNDRMVDIVAEGFDVALRIGVLKDSSLIAHRISPIRHALCASPAYLRRHGRPKAPRDLARHAGIIYSYVDPRAYWAFKDRESVDVPTRLALSNGDAIREAAMAGCGVAYLPAFLIYQAVQRGELEVLLPQFGRDPIALNAVFPSNRNVATKVRRFVDFCVTEFGVDPFWDRAVFGN